MFGLDDSKYPVRCLHAGEPLFRRGDRANRIFFVVEGRLRMERQTLDGRHVVLHVAKAGELFAEASLFSTHYHCDALALEPSSVRPYPKKDVLTALRANPTDAEGLLAYMARQLHTTRLRAEIRAVKTARERILAYLESVADEHRCVTVRGELQEIAAEIGLTREAFYRSLAILERDKKVQRNVAEIKLL